MTNTLTLTLTNDRREIERLSALITEFGAAHNWPPPVCFEVNLALDELLTNIITYGYDDDATHSIQLELEIKESDLIIRLEDEARPFNPLAAAAPDLDSSLAERPVGGLGVYLARTLMDEMEYSRQAGKNCLTLKKRLTASD